MHHLQKKNKRVHWVSFLVKRGKIREKWKEKREGGYEKTQGEHLKGIIKKAGGV